MLPWICRRHLYSAKTAAKDLTQNDVNLYYRLNAQSVPEAFPDFYQGTLVEGGGCKALHVSLSSSCAQIATSVDHVLLARVFAVLLCLEPA